MLGIFDEYKEEINMEYLERLRELQAFLNNYSAANMIGREFDFKPVRALCEELKKEDPENFNCFVTDGTDHELMVSVSNFFMKLLNV